MLVLSLILLMPLFTLIALDVYSKLAHRYVSDISITACSFWVSLVVGISLLTTLDYRPVILGKIAEVSDVSLFSYNNNFKLKCIDVNNKEYELSTILYEDNLDNPYIAKIRQEDDKLPIYYTSKAIVLDSSYRVGDSVTIYSIKDN